MLEIENIKLIHGDCLEEMDKLINQGVKVDAIITDPPYGVTACKWDAIIPFEDMWEKLNKLIKPNGMIVLFGSEPFSSALRMSNINNYKYDWVWNKKKAGNIMLSKIQPMKVTENISVFGQNKNNIENFKNLRDYASRIQEFIGLKLKDINKVLGNRKAEHFFYHSSTQWDLCTEKTYSDLIKEFKINNFEGFRRYEDLKQEYIQLSKDNYFPIMELRDKIKKSKCYSIGESMGGKIKDSSSKTYTHRFPKNLLEYTNANQKKKIHPTQKPINFLEYLIKTYSKKNDIILDFTMGSGTTGIACMNTNRKFIGIEKDDTYFKLAKERIENTYRELKIS